jgi:predicted MPP superfamily phosphohydrolase
MRSILSLFGRLGLFLIIALLAGSGVLVVWAAWIEPDSLRVTEYPLRLLQCPPALAGLRISVIADVHAGAPFIDEDKIRKIVELSNRTHPDLVLLPGDIFVQEVRFGHDLPPEEVAAILAGLKARLGVYAIFGNHDYERDPPKLRRLLAKAGIVLLENTAVSIRHGDAPFWLLGISDATEGHADVNLALQAVTDRAPIIAFTHNPWPFETLPSRISLLVAGHSHGGQIRIPWLSERLMPPALRLPFIAGHYQRTSDLFVSTGIGTTHFALRFRVPPEISVLTLGGPLSTRPPSKIPASAVSIPP